MSRASTQIKRLLRSVGVGRDERLYESVTAQVAVARLAVELSRALVMAELPSAQARTEMTELEHVADDHRAALIRAMARTLVTPIDREDLFRLSRAIDDVVDALRDFVREYDLFEPARICDMSQLLEPILGGLEELDVAIATLRDQPDEAFEASFRAKKRAGGVRQAYQQAVGDMLRGSPSGMEATKNMELLRRLDAVGLSLHDAADALADGALKRVT